MVHISAMLYVGQIQFSRNKTVAAPVHAPVDGSTVDMIEHRSANPEHIALDLEKRTVRQTLDKAIRAIGTSATT